MSASAPTCRVIKPGATTYDGKQGFSYFEGIATETVGSTGICMHLLTIPPGGRAKAHMHESHETAIYCLEGEALTYWGHRLEKRHHPQSRRNVLHSRWHAASADERDG